MGSTPKPPDPYATAQAQGNANFVNAQQNAAMQNADQYNPYGSQVSNIARWDPVYDSKGKVSWTPHYQTEVQLTEDQQKLLGQQTGLQYNLGNIGLEQSGRLQNTYSKDMDFSNLQPWQAAAAPGEVRQDQAPTDRAAVANAMMQRYQRYADPRNQAQETQMAARGLSPGSQGYGTMQQAQGDEFSNATREAFLSSGEESRAAQNAYNQAAQQKYTMGADWASQLNNLRQGQATEAYAQRNQPLNEIMAMMGQSGPATPQFQPFTGPQMQAPNIGQMIYDDYNARSQQSANKMSGLFGIGGQIAGALPWATMLGGVSDRRLKQDIEPIGRKLAGLPLYSFRYIADPRLPQIGVMADEARRLHPDVVMTVGGFDHVDYGKLHSRHDGGH